MTTAMRRWGTRAARGAVMSGLALLLATLAVLVGTVRPTAAQSLTRGPVLIETHHTDLAGNIRLSTNEAGDVTQRLDYAPFGEVDGRSCTGDGDPTRSPQFQGKLRDPRTCLDDFGARDYYMVTGRFQSVDPVLPVETALRDPQQWNRYAYARNNPLIYTDPDGRWFVFLQQASMWLQARGPQLAAWLQTHGVAAYNWATRVGNSPAALEAAKTVAEVVTGQDAGPSLQVGAVTRWADITIRGRGAHIRNIATNLSKADFIDNLVEGGFRKTVRADGITSLEKDGARYVVRDVSTAGYITADYYPSGSAKPTLKIRLEVELF